MTDTIGKILRRQREARNLEVEDVGAYLKIKPSDVEAIEKEEWENVTRHLFRPALLKDYGKFLKIEASLIEEKIRDLPFESNLKNNKHKLVNIGEDIDLTPNKDMFFNFLMISILLFLVLLGIYHSSESKSRVLSTWDLVKTIDKIDQINNSGIIKEVK